MAMAQTVTEETNDDAKLLRDVELQRSLLNADPSLRQRFDQALRDRPDTISIAQFAAQFWATRVHLLRSHQAEMAQGPGTYNVLAVIKPDMVDGGERYNLIKEQIHLIFSQHPLVKRAYNENVPKLSERDFWTRFLGSRLVKKLRGERFASEDHRPDPIFDKYLDVDEDAEQARQLAMPVVPRFIDVAGNEQNHSQRLGNRPDWTMQPNSYDKVPILRTLNRMSEKMMAIVPPSDSGRHGPVGLDEQTYNELLLRDLQRADGDNRVILTIRGQGQSFTAGQGLHTSSSASTYAKRTPAEVLSTVQHEFANFAEGRNSTAGLSLESAIGIQEDSSSEEEEATATQNNVRVGSKRGRAAATTQIIRAIKKRHLLNDDYMSALSLVSSEQAVKLGISQSVFEALAMTHNTTVEFLHYFWTVFLSGDPDRANEVGRLIETLDKSLDRISAVAESAESEWAARVDQLKRENEAYTKRTGKKRRFDTNSVEGGAKAVNKIVSPLVRAIRSAKDQFETALHEQMAQAAASANKPSNAV